MLLREMTDTEAMDATAELLEYIETLTADKEFMEAYRAKGGRMRLVKLLVTKYRSEVLHIISIVEGVDTSTYKWNLLTLPQKVLGLLNDPEVGKLFTFVPGKADPTFSGNVSANTAEAE